MRSKQSFLVYLILIVGISFFAFKGLVIGKPSIPHTVNVNGIELPNDALKANLAIVPNKYEKIIKNIVLVLNELHYAPKQINDDFSKLIFNNYFTELDYGKDVLLQSDIEGFKLRFETKIDDELNSKIKADFFNTVGEVYAKRLTEIEPYIKEFLGKPYDFTTNETVVVDVKKLNFAPNEKERKEYWRKKMKYLTLEKYTDLLTQNETAKVKKSNTELEKEARAKVEKVIRRSYDGLKKRATQDEYFKIFMNTVTQAYDPHTDYFPPVDQRSFNEEMSASYCGIGAILKEEEGNIKIGPLTTGSPAQKSGELTPGDIIVAVAQGDAEPVDITGFTTAECVKIIRGKENTEVRLTVKKADGTIKVIKLIRQKLSLESALAKSAVIEQNNQKIGVIYLPEFYNDFNDPNGPKCARDVAKEIQKLKAENVTGIIMDLRNNGGGSLYDVIQMVQLFVDDVPVVQVRDRDGKVQSQKSKDKVPKIWDGPLTVLVNELSASASEIFAAAIQDYNRGLVIGSSSTYGKGTVQRQIPLNFENNKLLDSDEYGSVKVTLQKFYRISGASTQLNGVVPDIIVPDVYEYLKFRERDNVSALPWDVIEKSKYKDFGSNTWVDVKANSSKRVAANPSFTTIKANTLALEKLLDKQYSLNLASYQAEQKEIKILNKKMDEVLKVRDSLPTAYLKADEEKYLKVDADKLETNKAFLRIISRDIYVNEAVKVLLDMINTKAVAKQ